MATNQHDRDILKDKKAEQNNLKKDPLLPEQISGKPGGILQMEQAVQFPEQAQPDAFLSLQNKYGNQDVQRIVNPTPKQESLTDRSGQLNKQISDEIQRARSGGSPLPSETRSEMTQKFGYPFGSVRVHNDQQSDQLSRKLQANAFTIGNNIFFRQGAFDPNSTQGKRTLTHELTHVVQQQSSAATSGRLKLGKPGDQYEQEADQVAASHRTSLQSGRAVQRATIQRTFLSGLFSRSTSATTTPTSPGGTTAKQWGKLKTLGVVDETQWGTFSTDQKRVILAALAVGDALAQKLIYAAQNPTNWPKDKTDASIYSLDIIKLIDGPIHLSFSNWNSQIKAIHKEKLITCASAKNPYIQDLTTAAIADQWPKDGADNEITDAGILRRIKDIVRVPFDKWHGLGKEQRKALLAFANTNKPFTNQLATAAIAGNWPKDKTAEIYDETRLSSIPEKIGLTFANWNNIASGDQRDWLLVLANETFVKELAQTALNNTWPKDKTAEISNAAKLKDIKEKIGVPFANWNNITNDDQRANLLGFAAETFVKELAQAALAGKYPQDNSGDITDAAKLKDIKEKIGCPFANWNTISSADQRGWLLALTAEPFIKELAQAALANQWPQDKTSDISDSGKLKDIRDKIGTSFADWKKIASGDQRDWLLTNKDKTYIWELASAAVANQWPKDQSSDITDDAKLKQIKDNIKLSFAQWSTITIPARRGSLLDAVSLLVAKDLVTLSRSAISGAWPLDGANADLTDMNKWKSIATAVDNISPAFWNGLDAATRTSALAETDDKKRKNIILSANFERGDKTGYMEKAGSVTGHAITDTVIGGVGLGSNITELAGGPDGDSGTSRAAGIVGSVGEGMNMIAQGTSFLGSIAQYRRGKRMSQGENFSRAAKKVGQKEQSKGKWGMASSGLGFVGSTFGLGGNLSKAIDPDSDESKATGGALGATGSVLGMIGSGLSIGKTSASMHSARRRSSAAKKHIKTGGTLTAEETQLNEIAKFTSKNQNKTGKGFGLLKGISSFLGSSASTVGNIGGIFSSQLGFGAGIVSTVFSGLGLLGGLGQWIADSAGKPKETDLEAKATQLIGLLKMGPPKGKDAAVFTREVLGIEFVDVNNPDTWADWIEEDEAGAKALIKSKLSKY